MFLPDLSETTMLKADAPVLAVGWLDRDHPYPRGPVTEAVYHRLRELLRNPWQPFVCAGSHGCELCRFEPEARGAANLFVPGDGVIYCCPGLITHYVNAHDYAPPAAFTAAVLACPDTRSMEYKRLLVQLGVVRRRAGAS